MRDKIFKIHKLMIENSDMPIKMFVNSEEFCDDYSYTSHEIVSVNLSGWCEIEDYIYTDEDELTEYYIDNDELSDKEARKKAVENLIDVILIKTGA